MEFSPMMRRIHKNIESPHSPLSFAARPSKTADRCDRIAASGRIGQGLALLGMAVLSSELIASAQADSFYLKNGELIQGSVLGGTLNTLTLRTGNAIELASIAQIERVVLTLADGRELAGDWVGWKDGVFEIRSAGDVLRIADGRVQNENVQAAGIAEAPADTVEGTETQTDTGGLSASLPSEAATGRDPVVQRLDTPIATEIEQVDAAILPPSNAELQGNPEPVEASTENTAAIDEEQHRIETLVDTVDEGTDAAVFKFQLDKPAERPLVILYAATDSSAKSGQDFEAKSGIVTFATGSTYAEVQVPIIDDDQGESDETFNLFLSGDPKSIAFDERQITVTINDDD